MKLTRPVFLFPFSFFLFPFPFPDLSVLQSELLIFRIKNHMLKISWIGVLPHLKCDLYPLLIAPFRVNSDYYF